jgi:hypothetical protein
MRETEVQIAGQKTPVIEYQGRRVVTLAMIDRLHQRPKGTGKRNFRTNKRRLKEGEDYVYVTDSTGLDVFRSRGILPQAAREITLLSESGYLLLVKSYTDDLAWDVQRQLVAHYFRVTIKGRGPAAGLPDLKAIPLLCHEHDRIGQAVSVIAAASTRYAPTPAAPWRALAKQLRLAAPKPGTFTREDMEARIWQGLCQLGGADSPDRIPRGALPRIWALLNHMNRFYSGNRERIGGANRHIPDQRPVSQELLKPINDLKSMTLQQAFSKNTVICLESQLGHISLPELLTYDRSFLRHIPNIGKGRIDEIEQFFSGYGLRLGDTL